MAFYRKKKLKKKKNRHPFTLAQKGRKEKGNINAL